jgi:hypothetical protein
MRHFMHADLGTCVLPVVYGLTFPTYARLRRPIELLHDTGGRQRLTSAD